MRKPNVPSALHFVGFHIECTVGDIDFMSFVISFLSIETKLHTHMNVLFRWFRQSPQHDFCGASKNTKFIPAEFFDALICGEMGNLGEEIEMGLLND
jgi:hypothetical protein